MSCVHSPLSCHNNAHFVDWPSNPTEDADASFYFFSYHAWQRLFQIVSDALPDIIPLPTYHVSIRRRSIPCYYRECPQDVLSSPPCPFLTGWTHPPRIRNYIHEHKVSCPHGHCLSTSTYPTRGWWIALHYPSCVRREVRKVRLVVNCKNHNKHRVTYYAAPVHPAAKNS
jgi:hypothetical protein